MPTYQIRTSPSGPLQEIAVPDLPIGSNDVTNQSSVSGATVTAALETLAASSPAASAVDIPIAAGLNPFANGVYIPVDVSAFWTDLDPAKDVPLLSCVTYPLAGNPIAMAADITGPAELSFVVVNVGGAPTDAGTLRCNVCMLRNVL